MRQDACSRGWDLARLEKQNKLFLLDARLDPAAVMAGEFSINGLLAILDHRIAAMRAKYVVIDAVDASFIATTSPAASVTSCTRLHEWLLDRGVTTIMTVKAVENDDGALQYAFLDFMADCVLQLDERVTGQVATRRLRVVKYRGSGFGRNEYPFVINEAGINLIPISRIGLQHRPLGERCRADSWLDDTLDGGFRRARPSCARGPPARARPRWPASSRGRPASAGAGALHQLRGIAGGHDRQHAQPWD